MRLHPVRWGLIACGLLVPIAVYTLLFFPRAITFSYDGDNCVSQLSLFPQSLRATDSQRYEITLKDVVRIGSYPIAARSACITAKIAPTKDVEHVSMSPFGWLLVRKTYIITSDPLPKVSLSALKAPIPATKPVKLTLSAPDELSTYILATDSAKSTCQSEKNVLSCDTKDLKLEQGKVSSVSLKRYFEGKLVDVIVTSQVEVLSAVGVKSSSVKSDQTVYDTPLAYTFELDKPLTGAKATLVRVDGDSEKAIESKLSVEGTVVAVTPTGDMTRPAKYKLTLTSAEASDGSGLNEPVLVPFTLSGGPQVSSVNVGANSVETSAPISLTFDQPLKAGQDIAKYVSVTGVPVTISQISPTMIRVALQGAGRCADFSITVKKGLVSDHDVTATVDWRFSSRTRCAAVVAIGSSSQGRAIIADYFGSGGTTYLFTGAIHGNELSSKYTMDRFVADIEANPSKIPSGVRIVVVPVVNPDGVAKASRNNARGVNLNRNFPTSNWTSDIAVSGGTEPGAGGASAGSEPETQALISLTNQLSPRLVVTHHSQGRLVNTNDVGVAVSASQEYTRLTGYRLVPSGDTTSTFGFEMSGTYEDWLYERGVPAILIELDTNTGNHYTKNSAAMWAMIRQ
ncbi:MAG: M14 family zinc carboxypeptidase [Candidatus Saccharimonas sp.]